MAKFYWNEIVKASKLSPIENTILKVCEVEQKRQTVFLRIPYGLEIPPELWNKLASSCKANKYHLKKSGRFPTVADLEDIVSDLDWLWPGWIPKGFVTMIAGSPGTGKSTIAHFIIKLVVTGTAWPDGTTQEPSCAVIIETESAQVLLNKHFKDMQIPADQVYMPGFDGDMMSQPDLGKPEHQARVIQLCEEKKPNLVVLDSIGGAHTKGENRIEDVRPMMEFLAGLARDYDCAVLTIHHLKKRNGEFADADLRVDDVRGSSAITAFTRSLLGLSWKRKQRVLEVVKSNVAEIGTPWSVEFIKNKKGNVGDIKFSQWSENKPKSQIELCAEWLSNELETNGAQAAQALIEDAKEEGFSRVTVFRASSTLPNLVKSGHGKGKVWAIEADNGFNVDTDDTNDT